MWGGGFSRREFRKYYPTNLEELKHIITGVWASVSLETCHYLVGWLLKQMK